jgi:hypothetical protein
MSLGDSDTGSNSTLPLSSNAKFGVPVAGTQEFHRIAIYFENSKKEGKRTTTFVVALGVYIFPHIR